LLRRGLFPPPARSRAIFRSARSCLALLSGSKQGQYMDLNHFSALSAASSPVAYSQLSPGRRRSARLPPGGPATGAHRSECGDWSDGRRSTCPRALGRGGLRRAPSREMAQQWMGRDANGDHWFLFLVLFKLVSTCAVPRARRSRYPSGSAPEACECVRYSETRACPGYSRRRG
jgi:hypothetical protein